MPGRWIDEVVFAEGIREFASRAGAEVSAPDASMYLLGFPTEGYEVLIGIEGDGMVMSWAAYCGPAPQSTDAPALLQQNRGGVEGSCFYFSVHLEDEGPMLFLETRQFLDPGTTAKDVTRILGTWYMQFQQAKDAPQMGMAEPSEAAVEHSIREMLQSVARQYKWRYEEGGKGFWMFVDSQNQMNFGIEFMKSDVWMWTFNTIVFDLDQHTRIDAERLLRLNDGKGDDGLVWCFYSVGSHELGESLYLKFGAITPANDLPLASRVIATVLRNMQNFTLRTRNTVRN